jgi:hemerythrin-like domain-containing protein
VVKKIGCRHDNNNFNIIAMAKKPGMTTLDDQVMENVRRLYRETAEEGVPERFMTLLKQLREAEEEDADPEDAGDDEK